MHQVSGFASQQRAQPPGEAEIQFAAAGNSRNRNVRISRSPFDPGAGRTHQGVFDAAFAQRGDQPDHLLRAAVIVTAGFYVNDFHSACREASMGRF